MCSAVRKDKYPGKGTRPSSTPPGASGAARLTQASDHLHLSILIGARLSGQISISPSNRAPASAFVLCFGFVGFGLLFSVGFFFCFTEESVQSHLPGSCVEGHQRAAAQSCPPCTGAPPDPALHQELAGQGPQCCSGPAAPTTTSRASSLCTALPQAAQTSLYVQY